MSSGNKGKFALKCDQESIEKNTKKALENSLNKVKPKVKLNNSQHKSDIELIEE